MKADPDKLIFGVSPYILRSFAKECLIHDSFNGEYACYALGAPIQQTSKILKLLTENDFLELEDGYYFPLKKFTQLGLLSITYGISRAQAETKLKGVIRRAIEINSGIRPCASKVSKIAVFGSYLTDAETLGDLDIAYDASFVPRSERAIKGRNLTTILRGNDTDISVHSMDEVIELETPYVIVFEAKDYQK